MSFGYSVSDFLGVVMLNINLIKALNESCGVSVELRCLFETLASLGQVINIAVQTAEKWELAHPNSDNKATFNALIEDQRICQRLLENFIKDSKKYTKQILQQQGPLQRNRVKREWAKIR
ncbi:hypothetical protein BDD12DRAFT_805018 [Trichophaea hybrida]|nr:hypothetical protein BDD12DRAFT_805018 [Trichophaea hybrida]